MSLETKQIFEFGDFRLDVEERTLERLDGTRNGTLPDKTFETLALLVSRHGHLVTKEDFLGRIWPDTIVEENNLDKRIHHLRKYLGEKPDGGSYIETVRGRGYRFVGSVRSVEVSGSWIPETYRPLNDIHGPIEGVRTHVPQSVPVIASNGWNSGEPIVEKLDQDTESNTFMPSLKWRIVTAGLTVLVVGAALIGYFGLIRGSGTITRRSFAVLPLKPIDVSTRSELYELGTANAIIDRLNSIAGFVARPLSATRQYSDLTQDPIAAGREQIAEYVISSSYQLDKGTIRVSWQLIDVAKESIEETHTFEYTASSLFALQDALAANIGSTLMAKFGTTASGPPAKRGTDNEEAYRLYLQGTYLTAKMGRENLLKAVDSLEQAVALDPNYAQAWAAKALAHRGVAFTRDAQSDEQYQRSVEAVNRTLAIDPMSSEAYSALCSNKLYYEFDFPGAERACRKAVELNPNSSVAHSTYAMFLNCRGRSLEAIEQIQTAIDLDPGSFFNRRIYGNSLYFARRYEEAFTQYKRLIELEPNSSAHANIVLILEAQGNYDEAFKYLLDSLDVQKKDASIIERVKTAYREQRWRGVLVERVTSVQLWDTNNFRLAGWYARLGDKDKAFEYLEKAYQEHYWAVSTLEVEPQIDPLRADPRYAALLKRIQANSSGN